MSVASPLPALRTWAKVLPEPTDAKVRGSSGHQCLLHSHHSQAALRVCATLPHTSALHQTHYKSASVMIVSFNLQPSVCPQPKKGVQTRDKKLVRSPTTSPSSLPSSQPSGHLSQQWPPSIAISTPFSLVKSSVFYKGPKESCSSTH